MVTKNLMLLKRAGTLILRPPDLQRDSYVANILASTPGARLALLVAYSQQVVAITIMIEA